MLILQEFYNWASFRLYIMDLDFSVDTHLGKIMQMNLEYFAIDSQVFNILFYLYIIILVNCVIIIC